MAQKIESVRTVRISQITSFDFDLGKLYSVFFSQSYSFSIMYFLVALFVKTKLP